MAVAIFFERNVQSKNPLFQLTSYSFTQLSCQIINLFYQYNILR